MEKLMAIFQAVLVVLATMAMDDGALAWVQYHSQQYGAQESKCKRPLSLKMVVKKMTVNLPT